MGIIPKMWTKCGHNHLRSKNYIKQIYFRKNKHHSYFAFCLASLSKLASLKNRGYASQQSKSEFVLIQTIAFNVEILNLFFSSVQTLATVEKTLSQNELDAEILNKIETLKNLK